MTAGVTTAGVMTAGRVAIAVMAKAPQPGRVKTRLCPPLQPDQAAAMGAAFLSDVTANIAAAARAAPIDGWVAFAPAGSESRFDGMLAPGTRLLLADGSGEVPDGVTGFGRCLWQASERLLDMGYDAACVLNADSPTLPTSRLVRLALALRTPGERAVLGAAEDGGYYVLGTRTKQPRLFADIAWSTDSVAAQTRARAHEAGLGLLELPAWYDVDDAASLARLLHDLRHADGADIFPAPATTACVARLGLGGSLAA